MAVVGQGDTSNDGNNDPPLPLSRFRVPAFIAEKLPRWKRKLSKLQRDPSAFIHDSALVRLLSNAGAYPLEPRASTSRPKSSVAPGPRVLLADDHHINRKNFPSLFEGLKACRARVAVGTERDEAAAQLIHACGNYTEFADLLTAPRSTLEGMTKQALESFRYHNVDLARVAVDEALSFVIMREPFQVSAVEKSVAAKFDLLWQHERETLILCCAAAMYWIDYWRSTPNLNEYKAVIIFSGSFIYGRVLARLAAYTQAKCFMVESFTTGFDYFFEERHEPIANNSRINYDNVIHALRSKIQDPDPFQRDRIRAINKLRKMSNKNVSQPPPRPLQGAMKGKRVVLVAGQVVNDFSLISGRGRVLSSLPAYKDFVGRLLQHPDFFVIFKAHPWERQKQNLNSPYTEDALRAWAQTLPEPMQARLMIVADCNLQQLFSVSEFVATLCSQSALEAPLEGLKPVVIGGAFYDNGGFTSNFVVPSAAADAILSGRVSGTLTLREFAAYEEYLALLVQHHLVNTDRSGVAKIVAALTPYTPQTHVKVHQSELAVAPLFDMKDAVEEQRDPTRQANPSLAGVAQ